MTETKRHDRRHIRYHDTSHAHIHLVRRNGDDEQLISSLIVDQCHRGLCCVIVGEPPVDQERFFYQENEVIRSELSLRHHRALDEQIQLLGFELTGKVERRSS